MPIPSDYIAHWTMDNISGGTLVDESANNHDGVITGATSVAGHIDNALSFNGVSDLVALPIAVSDVITTACFWFKTSATSLGGIVSLRGAAGDSVRYLATVNRVVSGDVGIDGASISGFLALGSFDGGYNDDQWHHYVGTINYTTKDFDVFVDGFSVITGNNASLSYPVSIDKASLGMNYDSQYFNGKIDHVRFYNRALTQAEITSLAAEVAQVTGKLSATFDQQINYNSGTLSATFDQQIKLNTGTLGARFSQKLSSTGKLSAAFDQQLANRSGKLSALFNQKLSNTGKLSATFDQQIFTQDVSNSRLINAEILLGGVDISSKITGDVIVEAVEGVARLADFDMLPAVGVIDPYDWINQAVIINFVENGQKSRLFTGVVHLPTFNTNTGITSFKCTDALQETVELTTRNIIDTIVGGWWDSLIFEAKDSWTYALQRLETIPASYDLDAYRNPRVTNWQPKAVADYSFTAIVDKSGKFQFAERRSIINSIKLKVDVRFNRLWSKKYSGSWKIPTTFDGWLEKPYGLPAKQMILDSVNGFEVIKAETTGLPDSGFFNLNNSNLHHWTLTDFAKTLARSAYLELKRRWSQTVTKTHDITLQAQASIDKHGLLQLDQTSSINIDNGKDWESDTPENLSNEVVVGAGASIFNDDIDYDNAINTVINLQSTKILSSHRKNKYTFDLPLHPGIDLDKTLSVAVPRVSVKGKVSRIKHVISMAQGNAKAISTIELSLYRPNIASQSSDSLAIDTTLPVPSSAANNLELDTHIGVDFNLPADDESWQGWVCNYDDPITQQSSTAKPIEVYDERWNLQVPEVSVIERDEEKITQQNTINIAIPQDQSTITQV